MKLVDELNTMDEAKANPKMISKMTTAIEKEDEKTLLKFMAMDKKNFFSVKNLEFEVEDGNVTAKEAKKLGTLSIGVGHALKALSKGAPDVMADQRRRALERVKQANKQ